MQGVDPKAVKYASLTPYNYAGNNPVFWNDPLGDDYYVSNRLYNLAMEGFRNTYVAGQAPRTAIDPGGGGYFNNWINAYGGGASWTPGGGWTELTNGQALEAGINYNNRHHSWSYTALNNTGASTGYGAGTFMVNYNGGNYGGNYHTENGMVVSVALSSVAQANNGGWFATSAIMINVFTQPINYNSLKSFDFGIAQGGGGYNIDNAVNYLNSHAYDPNGPYKYGRGQCSPYTPNAINAGFGDNRIPTNLAGSAYGPSLLKAGFTTVPISNLNNYTPIKGDIAVMNGPSGGKTCNTGIGGPCGHIQMYNGDQWVSDFFQTRPFWPGSSYENAKPQLQFQIYRWITPSP
jgi:hypothetical protein